LDAIYLSTKRPQWRFINFGTCKRRCKCFAKQRKTKLST